MPQWDAAPKIVSYNEFADRNAKSRLKPTVHISTQRKEIILITDVFIVQLKLGFISWNTNSILFRIVATSFIGFELSSYPVLFSSNESIYDR